ncbi:hypothetical protein [Marivita cryptomonadis]|uniref:Uncharacterized protein n=1 Tax=Marivita cryptomonadis TaxID=505252 RepID=A0ABS2A174_9RHOB|nr:hypothetical protein [Marivita cryptomonadis]MCR9169872.1 hypothetical protein [Paracoccaceae bacterium]MBM2333646.1 hypothetical protein [Marivita cryptomonadis]MBM2347895.1 hypothetical protein [Marivita cryptomonadis]MBM2352576.1 hypothetical protein [Marivita cryptomonadis]MBM2371752.1 hypothetical protein [Marivita cryptomonadis]
MSEILGTLFSGVPLQKMKFAKREFCGRIFCCFDRSRPEAEFFNKIGPEPTLAVRENAASQLHRSGRLCRPQHLEPPEVSSADEFAVCIADAKVSSAVDSVEEVELGAGDG